MTINEFYKRWNGKFLDADGVEGNQCVDLIKAYFHDVLGLPFFQGNAIDYAQNIPGLKFIKKGWFNYPKPNDVVIFNTGQYGHIGIVVWTRAFDFGCFQQNDPIGSPCSFKDYGYKKVIGWQHPTMTFSMRITAVNTDAILLDEACQLVKKYLPLEFSIKRISSPTIVPTGSILTQDEALPLIKDYTTPFVVLTYKHKAGAIYADSSLIGNKYTVKCMEGISAFNLAFELAHVLQYYTRETLKVPISVSDLFTPDEALLKAKLATVLPYLPQLASTQ